MRFNMRSVFLLSLFYFCISCLKTEPYPKEKINVDGLKQSVEVYRDKWGINHIYAQNQHDLFFHRDILLLKTGYFNLRFGVDKLQDPLLKY